ncbi:MAG TPA: extracellular solute-binding protein [Polyangiaceae bacterium]|nr:extracellular solute-binding protein [Polyangiaceae bacterium]
MTVPSVHPVARAERWRAWLRGGASLLAFVLTFGVTLAFAAPGPPGPSRVHVKYWEKWTGFEKEAMQALVDDFNRSQSRIWVDYLSVSAVNQKTLVATAGGNPPDLAGVWAQDVFDFADKEALTPLDEWARGTALSRERFLPVYWDLGVYRGKLFGAVSVPALNALHWNKRMFREAGLDPERPPRTLAELDDFATKLTRREDGRIVQIGFLPSDPPWWPFLWPSFFGGRLWDGGARISLDSPENLQAFRWVRGYAETYGVSALQNLTAGFGNVGSAQNSFMSQKSAMVLQGVWMSKFIDTYAPNLEWGAAPFPSLHAGDPPVTLVDADMLIIPRGAQHAREAFEFILFLTEQSHTEKLCALQRKNSPLRAVSEAFLSRHGNPYIRMFQALAASPGAVSTPRLSIWPEYRSEMSATFQRVWLLQASPEQALSEAQARLQSSWDRAQRRSALPRTPGLVWVPFALMALLVTFVVVKILRAHARQRAQMAGRSSARSNASLGKGLAFFSPWAIGLLVFTLYPVMSSVVYSFCDYSALSPPRFVGLENFRELLSDKVFFVALKNTLVYVLFALPLGLFASFSLALLLDSNVRGKSLYRTLVFLPSLTPVVASSMVWLWIFNAQYGILNFVLGKLSFGIIPPVAWLNNPHTALPSLIFMSVWGVGHTVVVLLAAMQDVPTAVYEAADIDGASLWHKVRHITIPLISPVLQFNAIMGIIGGLQVFSQPYIMTGGGPARSTLTYAMRLYESAFTFLRMGYAAAMAWILFLIILALTALAVRAGKSRVHYTGA